MFISVIFSFFAGLSTLVGVYLTKSAKAWVEKNSHYLISFAVGVILANSFFELLPESVKLIPSSWHLWMTAGFLILFLVEQFILIHACPEGEECNVHTVGTVSTLGIGFHSLIDGMVIAAAFSANFSLGFLTALAVIVHEIPEGVFTYTFLTHGKVAEGKKMFYSWIVTLATPIGTLFTVFILRGVPESMVGILLALAAGTFLYVAASDLTPETHRRSSIWNVVLVILGILVVLGIEKYLEKF